MDQVERHPLLEQEQHDAQESVLARVQEGRMSFQEATRDEFIKAAETSSAARSSALRAPAIPAAT
jgi:hypothetical protein